MNHHQNIPKADLLHQKRVKSSNSRDHSTLAVLLCLWVIAFLVRIVWIWPLHYNDWFGDAAYNVRIAEDIAEGKDATWVGRDSPFFVFTPLFHLLVALVLLIFPFTPITAAKLVSAFTTSFVPPSLYLLIYRLTRGRQEALTGALIAVFTPWFLAISVMTLATGLYIAFVIGSYTALICIRGTWRIPLSLIFAGLAALSRPEGAFFLLVTMIWVLIMAFHRKDRNEWRLTLLSVLLIGLSVVVVMMVIWFWRADDPFVWITSMLGHQADEAQKGKLTVAELGYLALIILATYSGFGGDPEPLQFDLYNAFRLGFAIGLLLLIAYGFWVVFREWRDGHLTNEIRQSYLFILTSWTSMLIFLILLDGRWIKYHIPGVILIQPLFITVAIFDLAKKIRMSSVVTQRWKNVSKNHIMILLLILSILSIQFLFAFTTNALLKSQMWEPRREVTEWLNKTTSEDTVIVIPHREYYVTAYTQAASMNYEELYNEANFTQNDPTQAQLLETLNRIGVLFLVTTSDSDRQDNPYYSQIIELINNQTAIEFAANFEWRSLSIQLAVLKVMFV
ncbi:MAG: hypothetical protein ACFFB3_06975 [Candidatus Hodarchaeota archaeon]